MGILYSNTFPVLVHSLPSGLAIYKSVLSSHGNKYNCMIGGPHKSFEHCVGQAGGIAQILAHFTEGLQQYRTWGPPKLDSLPMTCEELQFAQKLNSWEGDMVEINTVTLMNQVDDYLEGELNTAELNIPADNITGGKSEDQSTVCKCEEMPYCCHNLSNLKTIACSNSKYWEKCVLF